MANQSMQGKICLVTGATAGIGEVTAQALADMGATLVIVGRNRAKTEEVLGRIKRQSGNDNVSALIGDLSSQADVRRVAAEFLARHDRLHVLVNNAGAIYTKRQESVDGIELTWALNHLGYFLLTDRLLDALKRSAPARIVNVASNYHSGAKINFDDPEGKRKFSGARAYAQSKLANILFTRELARRLEGSGVTANSLHPGVVATDFFTNNGLLGKIVRKLLNLSSITPEEGAQTTIYLATSPEVEGVSGKYFEKQAVVEPSVAARDDAAASRLWALSERQVGLETPATQAA